MKILSRTGVPMKSKLPILAICAISCLPIATRLSGQTKTCTSFTVVTKDTLKNVKQGLSADDLKWFHDKIAKNYPGVCYSDPSPSVPIIFLITVTPDTYHGTTIERQTSTHSDPVDATVTDVNGNTAQVSGTVDTTTTSSTAVPYSFEYGIFTLSVERRESNGNLDVVHSFQQRGIYHTLYGIPLGGRGHHPVHAVIEDAAKWVNDGGLTGSSQPLNQPRYIASLSKGAEHGNVKAQLSLAMSYAKAGDYGQAAIWYRKAAEQGDVDAQVLLGLLYDLGHGVPQDFTQAASWYRKAAEQGNVDAQYYLGTDYDSGQGVPQDNSLAVVWWRKSAEQGNADAQLSLGSAYAGGKGTERDYDQASLWLRKATAQGNTGAENVLGLLYDDGQGVPLEWWQKAAERGDSNAQFALGRTYFEGHSTAQDYAQAYFWFDLAAVGKLDAEKQKESAVRRDEAALHLSPTALSQAQERARKWFEDHQAKAAPR
jgi:TPR repeat protein